VVAAAVTRSAAVAGLHPALLPTIDVIPVAGGIAVVTPLLTGGSLADLLVARATLDPEEVVGLLVPVCGAIAALHAAGVVHGDLKPSNILLAADGSPFVADLVDTTTGTAGTPAYLDPTEVGGRPSPAGDAYALAVVAYEALAGCVPYGGDAAEARAAASVGAHRSLRQRAAIPAPLADLVERALALDRSARPTDVARLGAELVAALPDGSSARLPTPVPPVALASLAAASNQTVAVDATSPTPASAGRAPSRRRHKTLASAAALVVLASAGVALVALPTGRAEVADQAWIASAAAGRPPVPCEPARPPEPPGRPLLVDTDLDGCAEGARWDGAVLTVAGHRRLRRYEVGRPGAQLLAGDWDGDGAATVALYDPGRGEILYVDRFPARVGEQVRARRVDAAPRHGRACVIRRAGRVRVRVRTG
jgi:serine/threonine-protein kinase